MAAADLRDIETLRAALIALYSDTVAGKADAALARRARELHLEWAGADPVLPREIALAVHRLVDIGWKTGILDPALLAETLRGLRTHSAPALSS